jgi:hypothetical protein
MNGFVVGHIVPSSLYYDALSQVLQGFRIDRLSPIRKKAALKRTDSV